MTNTFLFRFVLRLIVLSIFLLLLLLSFWQYNRGFTKALRLQSYTQAQFEGTAHPEGTKVAIEGHYLPFIFYLENQSNGRVRGYTVLSPFKTDTQTILINRGFSTGKSYISNRHHIVGYIQKPPVNPLIKDPFTHTFDNTGLLSVDLVLLGEKIQHHLHPNIIVELDPEVGLEYVSPTRYLTPERHYGYGFQWLVCALVYAFCVWRFWRSAD